MTYNLNGNITKLNRFSKGTTTATQIDKLEYFYKNNNQSNRLSSIQDNQGATPKLSGYPGGGFEIHYDLNGNIITMPDKGISSISYNHLNLPTQILQNGNTTDYTYRADGTKLKKKFTLVNKAGTTIINTVYLDGFQYSTPNTDPLRKALEAKDFNTREASTASLDEAFSMLDDRQLKSTDPAGDVNAVVISFLPTSEGFYDYENMRYIYQYKDHLGNVRVSYVKNADGTLNVMDTNDYCPFGMNFIKDNYTGSRFDPMAIPYNYKYNVKNYKRPECTTTVPGCICPISDDGER